MISPSYAWFVRNKTQVILISSCVYALIISFSTRLIEYRLCTSYSYTYITILYLMLLIHIVIVIFRFLTCLYNFMKQNCYSSYCCSIAFNEQVLHRLIVQCLGNFLVICAHVSKLLFERGLNEKKLVALARRFQNQKQTIKYTTVRFILPYKVRLFATISV